MTTIILGDTKLPENWDNNILVLPSIFTTEIMNNKSKKNWDEAISVAIGIITGKKYSMLNPNNNGSCISIYNTDIVLDKKKYKRGTMILVGKNTRKNNIPYTDINFYETYYLGKIYLTKESRIKYMKKVQNKLSDYKKNPEWKQCPEKLFKLIPLGQGCYGNVSKTTFNGLDIAVKTSKIKKEGTKMPYDLFCTSWHEVYIMDKILKALITSGKSRNLPLLYETFTCKKCNINLNGESITCPCITSIVELADGDLKKYLSEPKKEEELLSCLFQIMAGIYSFQNFGQIMNFDIKKENILYYNIEIGGYFQYEIMGKKYYIPNFGKLFIVNDFGVSRPMSPDFPLYKAKTDKNFRLGSRYAVIRNNKFYPISILDKDLEKIKPEEITINKNKFYGGEFKLDKASGKPIKIEMKTDIDTERYLKKLNISFDSSKKDFYLHPDIIPPFEFYNDTQDAIRMFIGGKRTTQKGKHKLVKKFPSSLKERLKKYIGKGESHKDKIFDSPEKVCAGYFIESFFKNYLQKPENSLIIN
jgi:hypothetical protein